MNSAQAVTPTSVKLRMRFFNALVSTSLLSPQRSTASSRSLCSPTVWPDAPLWERALGSMPRLAWMAFSKGSF